jgi:transcriptional regulator with XRE-family HTH domain
MIRGLSQQELARRIGATQPQVSDWMAGKKTPQASNLTKLAEAMDMAEEDLARLLTIRRKSRIKPAVETETFDN